MELEAIPSNPMILKRELDALKEFQEVNGSFKNFGNMPPFKGSSDSKQTFQTAYVLIPFLKFQNMVKKKYDDVIRKGFEFLDESSLKSDENALAVAAIAYGLHGDVSKSKNLLKKIEELTLSPDGLKCYKTMKNLTSCDLKHTSYTMLAYLSINMTSEAMKSVTWLLRIHNKNQYFSNTHDHAIATEAIAKVLSGTRVGATDFKVILHNEGNFNETIHITKENIKKTFEVEIPDYSLIANVTAFGAGICSITKIVEKTTKLEVTKSKFSLNVTAHLGIVENEAFVNICATYHAKLDVEGGKQTLFNVIYDVEFPSGYAYSEVVDEQKKTEIKV